MLHWPSPADQESGDAERAREVELKLDVDPDHASRLAELPMFADQTERHRQISVYFDTPKNKLRRNGWVLRVREMDGKFIQTIKRFGEAAGLFDREEWETEVDGLRPKPKSIAKTQLANVVKARQFRQLAPVCRCDVDRSTRTITLKGVSFELTYDEGLVEAGEACQPIHEIELELKDGDLGAMLSFARKIVGRTAVKIGVSAKSERGFALADGNGRAPVKATPVVIDPKMSVADGFATIATSCLRHFRKNEPLLIAQRDVEALHQMRVAVRRLRSALWLFRPALRDNKLAEISDELRRFTRELGAARNIDVILSSMPLNDPARSHLEDDRKRLYAKIIRKLDSRAFRLFIFDMFAWLHVGKWRSGKKAGAQLMPFAVKRLDRLWTKIDVRAGQLNRLSDEERHKLRIDTKKMRYAVEFLSAPLRPAGDERARFVKAAEGVQDRLGELNDLANQQKILFAWSQPSPAKARSRHLRAAKRHFGQLRAIGSFWNQCVN